MTEQASNEFIKGLVSVIIPTYNRYELLNHSIRSVLANTYKNVEIIVINDCSTDQRYAAQPQTLGVHCFNQQVVITSASDFALTPQRVL